MKHLVATTYPCLVKAKDDFFELEENDLLEVEDEQFLFIYPQNAHTLPFYINLSNPIENEFFSIVKKNNKTCILLEKPTIFFATTKESLSFDGKECLVEIQKNKICFEYGKKRCELLCWHPCKNFKVFKIKKFACLQFEKDLYLFSTTSQKLKHLCADNFEIVGSKIFATKPFFDSEQRQRLATFEIEEDIVLKEESFSYGNKKGQRLRELLPFKFMESIRAKDFSFAHQHLCESLQNSLDENKLGEFFGNITAFVPLQENEFIAFCQNKKMFVSFSTQDDEIQDISLDIL